MSLWLVLLAVAGLLLFSAIFSGAETGVYSVSRVRLEAVRAAEFPAGQVHAFVHGEANFVKAMRRELFIERGVPRGQASISGYWRLGADEDGWQSSKGEWNRQVEAEEAAAGS